MLPPCQHGPNSASMSGAAIGSESGKSAASGPPGRRADVRRGLGVLASVREWGLVAIHRPCDVSGGLASARAVMAGNQPDSVLALTLTAQAPGNWTGGMGLVPHGEDTLLSPGHPSRGPGPAAGGGEVGRGALLSRAVFSVLE